MKFFVDSADIEAIADLAATGMVDGVTTNPSLVAKSGRDFKELIGEICQTVKGPVSAEVTATDADAMLADPMCTIPSYVNRMSVGFEPHLMRLSRTASIRQRAS